MTLHPYRESLLSQLYPGFQHSSNCLVPAVLAFEQLLSLPERFRTKVTWRLDGGFGGDANVDWLLARGYHLVANGCSNRRSAKLLPQVKRWQKVNPTKYVGRVPTPEAFCRRLETFSIRYQTNTDWKHTYLFSDLHLSGPRTVQFYDQQGGAGTEFRSDKSGGLYLHKRRKHKRDAQEVWLLPTDMAHNYLAWLARTILRDSPLADFGFLRITRDLFAIPGLIEMEQGQLLSVKLLRSSPYAEDLLACSQRFWDSIPAMQNSRNRIPFILHWPNRTRAILYKIKVTLSGRFCLHNRVIDRLRYLGTPIICSLSNLGLDKACPHPLGTLPQFLVDSNEDWRSEMTDYAKRNQCVISQRVRV